MVSWGAPFNSGELLTVLTKLGNEKKEFQKFARLCREGASGLHDPCAVDLTMVTSVVSVEHCGTPAGGQLGSM